MTYAKVGNYHHFSGDSPGDDAREKAVSVMIRVVEKMT